MFKFFFYIALYQFSFASIEAQSKIGIENYTYYGRNVPISQVPIISFQNYNHWYAQARYNYEETQTASLYVGRSFSKQGNFFYNFIPMAGTIAGKFNGGSLGLNTEFGYRNFFASGQSQYSFSYSNNSNNFFYTWAEMGYQPVKWFYTGISVQQTQLYKTNAQWEPGLLIGFSVKKWSFPIYAFSPGTDSRYFILGVNMEWQHAKNRSSGSSLANNK